VGIFNEQINELVLDRNAQECAELLTFLCSLRTVEVLQAHVTLRIALHVRQGDTKRKHMWRPSRERLKRGEEVPKGSRGYCRVGEKLDKMRRSNCWSPCAVGLGYRFVKIFFV